MQTYSQRRTNMRLQQLPKVMSMHMRVQYGVAITCYCFNTNCLN